MYITLRILMEMMDCEFEAADENADVRFTGVELLDDSGSQKAPETLLVSTLSDALKYSHPDAGLHFICIRDRICDEAESPESMRGIIVARKNMQLSALLNSVQRIFSRIFNWQYDMKRELAETGSVQRLLDMSEGIIGNHISLMDSTFKLIACTENVEIDDRVTQELVRLGYHSPETVRKLQKFRRFEQFENSNGLVISTDKLISEYVVVKYIFRSVDTYSYFVVMVCCRRYSACVIDLFKMLVESISFCLGKLSPDGRPGPFASIATDLLDGRITSPAEAQSRAISARVLFSGLFSAYVLRFPSAENLPFNRILYSLSGVLHTSRVINYRHDILIVNLCVDTKNEAECSRETFARISETLGSEQCVIGISKVFPNLYALRTAYGEACSAIELGALLPHRVFAAVGAGGSVKAYRFSDMTLYYVLSLCMKTQPQMTRSALDYGCIEALDAYEKKYGVEYIGILESYLGCGCRATLTGELMHLHRNTVLYHIERIQELLGVDLSDSETRTRLSLALKMRELDSPTKNAPGSAV